MKQKNIICSVHFIPVYRFSIYKKLFNLNPKEYPVTESVADECVSLPFSSSMKIKEVDEVADAIKAIYT